MALPADIASEVQSLIQSGIAEGLKAVQSSLTEVRGIAQAAHAAAQAVNPETIQANVTAAATKAAEAVAQKATGDAFKARDDAQAAKAAETAASAKKADARKAFLVAKAAKIPAAYHTHVADSDDPKVLEEGLAKAVSAYTADAKAFGWKAPDLGTLPPAAATTTTAAVKTDAELLAMPAAERTAYLAAATAAKP